MRNKIRLALYIITAFIATVITSSIISSYNREIQNYAQTQILKIHDVNETVGDWLQDINTVIFNGTGFDQERRIKEIVDTKIDSVVFVAVQPIIPGQFGGIGSGFFFKVDGDTAWIMTNYHVVANKIENPELYRASVSTISQSWEYETEIVGYDKVIDIAILKIVKKDNEDWQALEFVDYRDINEGDPVMVIGHGLSLPWTTTFGQVTFNGRSAMPYNIMLQIDAVVNQGNSGGPVIGIDGKVYGIAQSILSPGRNIPGWDGVAFAVHARQAVRSMEYIMSAEYQQTGYVPYADLMFPMNEFDFEDLKDIAHEDRYPVYVDYSIADPNKSWAGQIAGIQQGDVILEMNGIKITSVYQIMLACIYGNPGDTFDFKILRNNAAARDKVEMDVSVVLEEIDHELLITAINR